MKTSILLCAVLLSFAPLVQASEADRIDARIKPVKTQVADHEKRIKKLEDSVKADSEEQNKMIAVLGSQQKDLGAKTTELEQQFNKCAKVADTNKRLDKQEEKINELTDKLNETRKLLDKNLEDIKKLREGADGTKKQTATILLILVPIAIIVILFASFFFWPRNQTERAPGAPDSGARPKCPRCGWEHDPGDTICKNPACKTQF